MSKGYELESAQDGMADTDIMFLTVSSPTMETISFASPSLTRTVIDSLSRVQSRAVQTVNHSSMNALAGL